MPEFLSLADVLANVLQQIGVLLTLPNDFRVLVEQVV
jgi:hypothetical protein